LFVLYLLLHGKYNNLLVLELFVVQGLKRINFNMASECHALLKSVCALKGVSVSEYVYKVVREDFQQLVNADNQVQQMLMNGTYPVGSNAYVLKEQIRKKLDQANQMHTHPSTP